jgi:hypothetical protein
MYSDITCRSNHYATFFHQIESVEELKDKVDEDGQYGWTAWRNYGCCIPGPGAFIGSSITGCLN